MVVALLSSVLLPSSASAEKIYLRGGRVMEGKVVKETPESVVVEVEGGQVTLPRRRIMSIQGLEKTSAQIPDAQEGPTSTFRNPIESTREQPADEPDNIQDQPHDSGPSHESTPEPLTPERLLKLADDLLPVVASLRGLEPKSPVTKQVTDRATIRQELDEELAREYQAGELANKGKALIKLGLLPAGTDFEREIKKLYVQHLAGCYDPHKKTLYIANWVPMQAQRGTVAHELVHALQDQHFDLVRYLDGVKDDSEAKSAREAVVEGEAVAVMLDEQLHAAGTSFTSLGDLPGLIERLLDAVKNQIPDFSSTPVMLTESMLFPYTYGLRFLQAVRRRGSWDEVSKLYTDPPESTEQIIHPAKYLDERDHPTPVTLPDLSAQLGEGWTRIDEDSIGEFGARLLIRQYLDGQTASVTSEGWDGDRYQVYEQAATKELALVWGSVWDSPRDAQEFAAAYAQVIPAKYHRDTAVEGHPRRWMVEVSLTSLEQRMAGVECRGQTVLAVEGVDPSRFEGLLKLLWSGMTPATDAASAVDLGTEDVLSAQAFYERGKAFMEEYRGDTGKLLNAIPYFEKAIALNKEFGPAYIQLGHATIDLAYRHGDQYESKEVARADPYIERATALMPESWELQELLAFKAFALGQYDQAVAANQLAITRYPEEAKLYLQAGRIQEAQGHDEQARLDYEQVLTKHPGLRDAVVAHDYLATVYQRLGKPEEADAQYSAFFQSVRDDPWAWNNYCGFLITTRRYPEAVKACQEALRLMDFGAARENLMTAYIKAGQLEQAEAESIAAHDSSGLVAISRVYNERSDFPKALSLANKAAEMSPTMSRPHVQLGYIYNHMGQSEQAHAEFERALQLEPEDEWTMSTSFEGLGRIAEQANRIDEAIQWAKKAVALSPKSAQTHFTLGRLYYVATRYQEAVASYANAVTLWPDYADAHYGLGASYQALGQASQATEHYRTYLRLAPSGQMAEYVRRGLQQLGAQ